MGRSERPLDPGDGPVQSFACDLRALRGAAGNVPYRELSKRAHYSVAAPSQAAAGRSLPSLPVTLAFVRACGGDVGEWEQRWIAISISDDRDSSVSQAPVLVQSRDPALARRGRRLPWRGVLVLTVAVVCTAVITDLVVRPGNPKEPAGIVPASQRSQLGKTDPIADGSDPNRAGCGTGAVTMAVARTHFPASQLSGQIELRYSPRCHAAWGRFEPADGWNPGSGTAVSWLTPPHLDAIPDGAGHDPCRDHRRPPRDP